MKSLEELVHIFGLENCNFVESQTMIKPYYKLIQWVYIHQINFFHHHKHRLLLCHFQLIEC